MTTLKLMEDLYKLKQSLKANHEGLEFGVVIENMSFWITEKVGLIGVSLETGNVHNLEGDEDYSQINHFVRNLDSSFTPSSHKDFKNEFKTYECLKSLAEKGVKETLTQLNYKDINSLLHFLVLHRFKLGKLISNRDLYLLSNNVLDLVKSVREDSNVKLDNRDFKGIAETMSYFLTLQVELKRANTDYNVLVVGHLVDELLITFTKQGAYMGIVELSNSMCLFKQELEEIAEIEDGEYKDYEDIQYRGYE
ncbi:hypothetical protein COF68_05470 [Bacillus toyonensis]|uniref:hypothetical protein n=1 Tax=Bacillus toyonensis TaxID=155322 RepID=UPI000BFC723B|nr:hypothetical protein [Bacillus toyonensis]PHE64292.1 hypothetical protein COF68_05470 [Bacillus toyonensis]